jgi:hypothetical protein
MCTPLEDQPDAAHAVPGVALGVRILKGVGGAVAAGLVAGPLPRLEGLLQGQHSAWWNHLVRAWKQAANRPLRSGQTAATHLGRKMKVLLAGLVNNVPAGDLPVDQAAARKLP